MYLVKLIRIDCDISDSSRTVQGTGSQSFQISQSGVVSASFSKDKTNNGTVIPDMNALTVQIVDSSGNIVATQTTTTDAGNVAVSHTF
jgi:hypothetical protein